MIVEAMLCADRGDYDEAFAWLKRMSALLLELAHPVQAQVAWMFAGSGGHPCDHALRGQRLRGGSGAASG